LYERRITSSYFEAAFNHQPEDADYTSRHGQKTTRRLWIRANNACTVVDKSEVTSTLKDETIKYTRGRAADSRYIIGGTASWRTAASSDA
jgi:hypothetical protein